MEKNVEIRKRVKETRIFQFEKLNVEERADGMDRRSPATLLYLISGQRTWADSKRRSGLVRLKRP